MLNVCFVNADTKEIIAEYTSIFNAPNKEDIVVINNIAYYVEFKAFDFDTGSVVYRVTNRTKD